jgi:hypothetical protein
MMKTIRRLDSPHLENSSHVVNVLSVVRNWQTKLWFQVSWKDTFTQSTPIYVRNQLNILKGF